MTVHPFTPTTIDLVDAAAVTAVLGVTPEELHTMVADGELAAYDLDGNLRFRATQVAALAASRHLDGAA